MNRPIDLSIVIPAYNEEQRLERTIRSTIAYCRRTNRAVEVIVVDDGSRDGTSALVLALGAEFPELRLIRLAENQGKGYAVRSGVVNSRGALVLFQDADGATPIEELERLERALAEAGESTAVAIGSRAIKTSAVRVNARFYRRLMGRAFHKLVAVLTVQGIADTQCGFKLFRRAAAHDLFSRMRMRGFSFDVEVLLMAQRQGYAVREIAVNWTHQPGSRVNLVLDSLRMARDLFIIKSHALRGHYDEPRIALVAALNEPRSDSSRSPIGV